MKMIKKLLKAVLPHRMVVGVRRIRDIIKYWKLRNEIIAYLRKQDNPELKSIEGYLQKQFSLPVFPYAFADKYKSLPCEVYVEDGYPYVLHNGKRLYGPQDTNKADWKDYYIGLLCEQDSESPHRCMKKERMVTSEDVVADVGDAEGIFALDIIEKVRKVYLFECSERWIIPLQKTFAPWKDKVEFVHKFVSDKTQGDKVAFDDFFAGRKITFVKADIEGAERLMLIGGKDSFEKKIKQCLLCCYHLHDDAEIITCILKDYGYNCEENSGYMIFKYDSHGLAIPFLRRGVLYGRRNVS